MNKAVFSKLENYKTIAVTGKMASGKNYVCSLLENYGWKSVDADSLVHDAIRLKTPEILSAFEKAALNENIIIKNEDGSINRRSLGKFLFSNPELLSKQESIVYPAITEMTKEFVSKNPKAIINATVLFKTPQLLEMCDAIVFVTAPFLVRLFRARKRDKMPFSQILRRFYAQKSLLSEYKKSKKPVIVVKNL